MDRFIFMSIVLFFGLGALDHGFLYEGNFLFANLFLFIVLVISLVKINQIRIQLHHISFFLLILMYWISVIYAVDAEKAIYESIRVTVIFPFIMLISLFTEEQMQKIFRYIPLISGLIAAIGIVFQMQRNGRLESTIEYANTLAILLLVSLLVTILFYIKEKRRYDLIVMVILATGLWLTFSRSVWVLWALSLIVVCVLKESRLSSSRLIIVAGHAASLVIAALLKRDILFLWPRLKSIQPGTSELQIRLIYWKDSLRMIADHHFWTGTGGGGWSVLLPMYRSQDYFVRFVHNHFLQIVLDVGVVGLLAFLTGIFLFYRRGLQGLKAAREDDNRLWCKIVLLIVTVLLLHAGFDFDLHFPLLLALLLFCMEYVMKDAENARLTLAMNKAARWTICCISIAAIAGLGWVATGRHFQDQAQQQALQGNLENAVHDYKIAAQMMPWVASVYYETAKAYVTLGNNLRDKQYYLLANQYINQAVKLVPQEELYRTLHEELERSLQ